MLPAEAEPLFAALRDVIANCVAGHGRERRDQLIDLGGALFDGHWLDGSQYEVLHHLREALETNSPRVKELAERASSII